MSKIVNIFVLVLTIVSIVLAFKLYEKREELVDRGDKMGDTINQVAANLDEASGTKLQSVLTKDALGHKQFKNLDKLLPQLAEQSKNIATQKNSLADTMNSLASTLEIEGISDADLKDAIKYQTVAKDLSDKVAKVQARNENILDKIVVMGDVVGVPLDKATLKDVDKAAGEVDKLNNKVVAIKEKSDKLIAGIGAIAKTLELSEPSLSGDDYDSSLASTTSAVVEFKGKYDTTVVNLAKSEENAKGLQEDLNVAKTERDKATAESQKRLVEINKLRKLISNNTGIEITPLEQNNIARLRYVQGEVKSIDSKLGFVVVSVGKYTKAVQKIGKAKNVLNADIPNNCKLTVARSTKQGIQFVAELDVFKVYDECAAANICETPKAGDVQIGDIVFFGREELAKLTSPAEETE